VVPPAVVGAVEALGEDGGAEGHGTELVPLGIGLRHRDAQASVPAAELDGMDGSDAVVVLDAVLEAVERVVALHVLLELGKCANRDPRSVQRPRKELGVGDAVCPRAGLPELEAAVVPLAVVGAVEALGEDGGAEGHRTHGCT